jgi:hypothetical protein
MQRSSLLEKESLQLLFNSNLQASRLSALQLFPSFFLPLVFRLPQYQMSKRSVRTPKGKQRNVRSPSPVVSDIEMYFPLPFFKKKYTPVL